MIGISSNSAGVLLLPKNGADEYIVIDVVEGEEKNAIEAEYLYSAAQDWQEIEGTDVSALIKRATHEYWLDRAVSLLRIVIAGVEKPLATRVSEHVEELIGSRVFSEEVLSSLLVAPLADKVSPRAAAQSALSNGFAAVASILDELTELQPLIRRFVDIWLRLPERAFANFSISRQVIWGTVAREGKMNQLLCATTRADFTAKWNLLVFHFDTAQHRFGIKTLGQEICSRLFPREIQLEVTTPVASEEERRVSCYEGEKPVSAYIAYVRAESQISAIAQAVAEGRDAKAEKFLRELIKLQTSSQSGASFASKSLCNIAQRCAEMFRTDFEAICLEEAMRINKLDTWTLVQYGDHLKRLGKYQEALKVITHARNLGEGEVAISSEADVYSQQGDYNRAIEVYKTIENWQNDSIIMTAIADNLRRMGRFEEAQATYEQLIRWEEHGRTEFERASVRAKAGMAEIAKRQGRLHEAREIYSRVLAREGVKDLDRAMFKLSLCNVLKLMERFDDAFAVVAQVVEEYPFAMEARFVRGSILGLVGKELEGLKDLPAGTGSRSWREWLRPYYRGLLLLKLERFVDAKKFLVEELSEAIVSGEEKAILRMAAALWFLREDEITKVNEILSEIPPLSDCYAQYLSLVLRLHSATLQEDLVKMSSIRKQINELNVSDTILEKAVVALEERNFSRALSWETDAFLKQAA